MTALQTAQYTWEYLVQTGRLNLQGEEIAKSMGLEKVLTTAAANWEANGCPNYIQGMKREILALIWK